MFIKEVHKQYTEEMYRSELRYLNGIDFVSDMSWTGGLKPKSDCLYKWDNIRYEKVSVFDGSYVIRYICHKVVDGEYTGAKFKTESLTQKYETKAAKNPGKETVLFAITDKKEEEHEDSN